MLERVLEITKVLALTTGVLSVGTELLSHNQTNCDAVFWRDNLTELFIGQPDQEVDRDKPVAFCIGDSRSLLTDRSGNEYEVPGRLVVSSFVYSANLSKHLFAITYMTTPTKNVNDTCNQTTYCRTRIYESGEQIVDIPTEGAYAISQVDSQYVVYVGYDGREHFVVHSP